MCYSKYTRWTLCITYSKVVYTMAGISKVLETELNGLKVNLFEFDIENEENFNLLLKINSAEDLLLTDEDTGEQVYAPINVNDVVIYKRETDHLFNEINHAISEIKYYSEKHIHIDYLFCIYQTLSIEIC